MSKATLLLADNAEDFLNERKEFLEEEDYLVLTATTPDAAWQTLRERHIDLAILDLRLKDNNDEKDFSGLVIAREVAPSVPKIILTEFPSVTAAREALSPAINGIPAAIDFIVKAEGNGALLQAVRTALQRNVFIVHGRNKEALEAVELLLTKLGLRPIVLQQQRDHGRTVIKKFEDSTNVAFAVVLMTPDDVGSLQGAGEVEPRARQNVIFELGYFVGKLECGKVCVLHKGVVEIPSDYCGVLYISMDAEDRWKIRLADEMADAGLTIVRHGLR